MPNDFDLVGVRHAARARELARVRLDRIGPEHPDFASADPSVGSDALDAEPIEPHDAAVDFASLGPVVDRMRAAFFGRS